MKNNSNNEKNVRALIQMPGNDVCADCGKQGKAVIKFCSVKLGVFLCNQCYAAHRALGAHITRVKCLGLDGFTDQEVALLSSLDNARVNARYEATMPTHVKPPPTPCNGCSSSTCKDCKERLKFIQDKYESKLWYSETTTSTSIAAAIPTTASANSNNSDPFGLFAKASTNNNNSTSSTQPSQTPSSMNSKSADTDFFVSFGL